jgi:hypothetical protein
MQRGDDALPMTLDQFKSYEAALSGSADKPAFDA